jgi:hypothetical protein
MHFALVWAMANNDMRMVFVRTSIQVERAMRV